MMCHSPFVVVELVVVGLTRPGGTCDFATPTVGIAEGCYDNMMPSLTCVFVPPLIRSDLAARKGNNRNASASIMYIVIKTCMRGWARLIPPSIVYWIIVVRSRISNEATSLAKGRASSDFDAVLIELG